MEDLILQVRWKKGKLSDLIEAESSLCLAALEACKNAYAPYSSFHVGAAVLLEDNTVVTGNNQENIAYPSGVCAERTALYYANAQYPGLKVKAIAIAAVHDGNQVEFISPCGACRQVMAEAEARFGQPIAVLLYGRNEIRRFSSLRDLLPFSFEI